MLTGRGSEPDCQWVRPDLNRSRQHPKLVGFLAGGQTARPRARTKLPHGPAGVSKDCGTKNPSPRPPDHPNGRTSSISSAWDRIMRRQQYRFSPSVSRTLPGSSPPWVRSTKGWKALPTTLPHVKHRTGMIIDSPVGLLPLLARATAQRVLRQLSAGVRHDQSAVVLPEQRLEVLVVQVLHEAAGDRRPDGIGLAHHAAAVHVHVDVDRVDLPARELERLEDLLPSELERVHLDGHAVDPNDAAALRERRPRDRGLALPTRHDRLHARTSNFDPRSFEISPRLVNGPCGARFATSMVSNGLSLNSVGTER